MSGNGSVIVGSSGSPEDPQIRACLWTNEGGIRDLGALTAHEGSYAYATNHDGTVVVGMSGDSAFLWRADLGMVDLSLYLTSLGLDLTAWTLTSANGVSADGLTIVGVGSHNGINEAWIASIPSPSFAAVFACGVLMAHRRRASSCSVMRR